MNPEQHFDWFSGNTATLPRPGADAEMLHVEATAAGYQDEILASAAAMQTQQAAVEMPTQARQPRRNPYHTPEWANPLTRKLNVHELQSMEHETTPLFEVAKRNFYGTRLVGPAVMSQMTAGLRASATAQAKEQAVREGALEYSGPAASLEEAIAESHQLVTEEATLPPDSPSTSDVPYRQPVALWNAPRVTSRMDSLGQVASAPRPPLQDTVSSRVVKPVVQAVAPVKPISVEAPAAQPTTDSAEALLSRIKAQAETVSPVGAQEAEEAHKAAIAAEIRAEAKRSTSFEAFGRFVLKVTGFKLVTDARGSRVYDPGANETIVDGVDIGKPSAAPKTLAKILGRFGIRARGDIKVA